MRMYFICADNEKKRFGVAVSKKFAGSVKRSRGKRMLRESLRRLSPWVKDGFWVVLSLRERGLSLKACDIYMDAAKLFERCGLLNGAWKGPNWSVDAVSPSL